MDSHTRKELKTDHFVEEVGHGFEFLTRHKKETLRILAVVLVGVAAVSGGYAWHQAQRSTRMELLSKAYLVQAAPFGQPSPDHTPPYVTAAERDRAAQKIFEEVVNKYPNSEEAQIAQYFLGSYAANSANWTEAEKRLQAAATKGSANTASLAKFLLAQVYAAQNRTAEAEKLLRQLIDKPTIVVSKEQASLTLGRLLLATNPTEAKKLLEPLRGGKPAISRAAVAALGAP